MGICRDVYFRQIGAKIAYYRTLHGLEQNQLADKVHISQSTLSRIERGKYGDNISISLLLDIAEGLEIDPSLLTTFSSMEKRMWAYQGYPDGWQ
ncbi:MAG: helix-turn-helix transcriptional regulator [Selenomonas sp.]|nr:helix-turn-helix transcriptional regulator [Selenomonas sp.]